MHRRRRCNGKLIECVLWYIEWGASEKALEKNALKGNAIALRTLESRPEVFPDLQGVWEAFNDLHRCRTFGIAPNPLTISDIVSYFGLIRLYDDDEREEWFRLLLDMDAAYLEKVAEKEKQRNSANAKTTHR